MDEQLLRFRITDLTAGVAEGVVVEWQGREFNSGPVTVELDESAADTANQGVLDYGRGRAQADFEVRLAFPEFSSLLEGLGVDPQLARPVRATIHSEGEILPDHSFVLSGRCELAPHALLPAEETQASVLPGQ
jgi:hypothetical protein